MSPSHVHHVATVAVLVLAAAIFLVGCTRDDKLSRPTEPVSAEAAYTEFLHDRLKKLGDKEIEAQVAFRDWLSTAEVDSILTSNPQIVVHHVGLRLPGIRNDLRIPRLKLLLPANNISGLSEALLANANRFESLAPDYSADIRFVAENPFIRTRIWFLRVRASSAALEKWWSDNPRVRLVQPIVNELDHAQTAFEPEAVLGQ